MITDQARANVPAARLMGALGMFRVVPEGLRGVPRIPFAIFVLFVAVAVVGPYITPQDPFQQSLQTRLAPPAWAGGSTDNLLGTDSLGRDVLSRLMKGARIALAIGVTTAIAAGILGAALGMIAGFSGGAIDYLLMRLTDGMIAMPFLVVALAIAVVLPPSIKTLVAILIFFGWAGYARIIRSTVLQLREAEFIQLAKVAGCSSRRILWRHISPNVTNTFVVLFTLQLATVIIAEASLSFLGMGVPPPEPSWGLMLSDGRRFVDTAWWISVFPGVAITLVVLSVNMLGDWLRVRLDPKFRQV